MRVSLVVLLILGLVGCRAKSSGENDRFDFDSGADEEPPDPNGPYVPPPIMDSGTAPLPDAGADSGMPDTTPNFVLECGSVSSGEANADPLGAWEEERAAHGVLGYEATFVLDGASYRVTGQTSGSGIEAPFALHMNGTSSGLMSFTNASVEGIAETGRVELYPGDQMLRGHADVTSGSITGLAFNLMSVENGTLDGSIATTEEQAGPYTMLHHSGASVADLTVEVVQTLYLYPEGTSGLDERVELLMPTEPIVIESADEVIFYNDPDVSLQRDLSEALEVEYEAFGIAGDFAGGTLDVPGLDISEKPVAVFGAGALKIGASTVETLDEAARVTQAVNVKGLMIPAEVEIVPAVAEVWVRPNEEQVVELYYRERSYLGDAVLATVEIGGDAERLLELQTVFDVSNTYTAQIIEAVVDTGWAAPLAGIAALPVVSIVFFIDIFDCIFGGCADQPDPLRPFPQWISAGDMGSMELRVKGALGVGTYQTSVTFVGRNYCPVTVPLTVHVGEPPSDAGPEDGGDDAATADAGAP